MKVYELGTGYTPIPAQISAATEIVVEELTKGFVQLGVPVEIIDIASKNRANTSLPIQEVSVPGVFSGTDVQLGILHKLKRVVYSVALAQKLKKLLKKAEEKVVLHFHNQYNLFFFLKMVPESVRSKANIAYTNHSYIWHGEWNEIKRTIQRRYFQEVFCLKHADHVFVLNGQTKRNLVEHLGVDPARIHLIDNGVNMDVYKKMSHEERRKLLEDQDLVGKKVFVHVGSVCDRKNQLEAVRMLLPFMQSDPDVVFCYAGGLIERDYQEKIIEFAKENHVEKQVRYFGEMQPGEALNKVYNCAEAMVFPSKAEGFSLVIIEAMSAGIPVLINCDLHFSLENHCLQYANEDEFQKVVRTQIIDTQVRENISEKARKAVAEKYSWKKIAGDYVAAWERSILS